MAMSYYKAVDWVGIAVIMLLLACYSVSSLGANESEILVKFKNSLSNDDALKNWVESVSPCNNDTANWTGLRCSGGSVNKLILEDIGLTGMIDMEALSKLPNLRTLSLMNNSFDGPMPAVNKLGSLKMLYLSYNKFSGEIPDDSFSGLNSMKKVYMARNNFVGTIPKSLAELPQLLELNMEGNQFQGKIPDFKGTQVSMVDLAHNRLVGPIPAKLSAMNSTYFTGNKDLCGKPLGPCKSNKKRSIIIIVVVVGSVLVLSTIAVISYVRSKRTKKTSAQQFKHQKAGTKLSNYDMGQKEAQRTYQLGGNNKRGGDTDNGKLYFVRKDREEFELQELLRASAQVLGSGSFGSSYKAVLLGGPAMVVKRFRQMNNLGRDEFYEHMRRIGTLSHPNLLPLVAFYYGKEEKLLVTDFVPNGSLASYLHARTRRGPGGQPGLEWPMRLKIVKGVARGLTYLYKELPKLTLPHGHLKSSNVLLDEEFEPLLTEYGLVAAMNKDDAQQFMAAYKSPEFTQYDRATRKTDVWSLGILILEMLTGKFPANYLNQGKGKGNGNSDLAAWVNSVVREEWTGEVFDKEMKDTKNGEGEMLKLLKIGMCCCEWDTESRWDLMRAAAKIEELKERDTTDIEDYSSYNSEADHDVYSSRAITDADHDFSFSLNP